jgi:hypothetical protein
MGKGSQGVAGADALTKAALKRAIARAEAILPGREGRAGKRDPRWQAIIRVGAFIESHPQEVCDFAMRWARRRGRDLQSAIHCCLIEHLLEHHFDVVLPRMRQAAMENARVAEHFIEYRPWFKFGQAELPKNAARLKRLASELRRHYGVKDGSELRSRAR